MPKVEFIFDKEKDLWNIWATGNSKSKWYDFKNSISPNILKLCEDKTFEGCKDELEKSMRKVYDSGFIEIFIESMQKSWDKINDEFFERLEKVMKKPFEQKKIIAYITTSGRCPYDYKEPSFMVSMFFSFLSALQTSAHEIMHIQFHNNYWKQVESKIGEEKTGDLKEALSVLLNLEFKDLWFVQDKGYESHQELRGFIEKEWNKEKDFDVLLEKCIEFFKI